MEAVRPEWSEEELPLPAVEQHEVAPEPVTEVSQALSFAEGELATKALEKQPVIASDLVSKAAEKDKPIERELEERHEKRGSLDAQQAVSIGNIIANLPERKQSTPKAAPQPQQPVAPTTTADDEDSTPQIQVSLYSQAIRTGFVGALIIILVFILLLIIT